MAKIVFVGCKLPSGIILQLRDEASPASVLQSCKLNGSAMDMQPFVREDGIGLTEVDSEFWARWVAWAVANNYAPYINGFVFAASKASEVRVEAREKINEATRLEGLSVPLKEGDTVAKDPRLVEFKASGITAAV